MIDVLLITGGVVFLLSIISIIGLVYADKGFICEKCGELICDSKIKINSVYVCDCGFIGYVKKD